MAVLGHPGLARAAGRHQHGRRPPLLCPIAAAVIGGTSLFDGRGTMKAAILGALLPAVTVDSASRRGREQSGRA
jgi:ABC-type xylose transport system permease subunit